MHNVKFMIEIEGIRLLGNAKFQCMILQRWVDMSNE